MRGRGRGGGEGIWFHIGTRDGEKSKLETKLSKNLFTVGFDIYIYLLYRIITVAHLAIPLLCIYLETSKKGSIS